MLHSKNSKYIFKNVLKKLMFYSEHTKPIFTELKHLTYTN